MPDWLVVLLIAGGGGAVGAVVIDLADPCGVLRRWARRLRRSRATTVAVAPPVEPVRAMLALGALPPAEVLTPAAAVPVVEAVDAEVLDDDEGDVDPQPTVATTHIGRMRAAAGRPPATMFTPFGPPTVTEVFRVAAPEQPAPEVRRAWPSPPPLQPAVIGDAMTDLDDPWRGHTGLTGRFVPWRDMVGDDTEGRPS